MSKKLKKSLMAVAALAALALGGGALAQAGSGDSGQTQGQEADQAKAAALKITHGGEANAVEQDNENGATWEVEVTKTDGKTVDVRLDDSYGLVVVEGDHEDANGR
jgi:outer membrane lipoprotein SlyB